jgi:hypothetical protein
MVRDDRQGSLLPIAVRTATPINQPSGVAVPA